ncbi:MAG: hypothetical protein ACRD0K_18095 [Egibacteraceae bacterium]
MYHLLVTKAELDANAVAIDRAELTPDVAAWLRDVKAQVGARLERIEPGWRKSDQADAVKACAFGLLLGHLAERYPHMTPDLHRVAERHPSFTTLPPGKRLATLRNLAAEPERAVLWIGPLLGIEDPGQIRKLLD